MGRDQGIGSRSRRGAYPRARFREAEQIDRRAMLPVRITQSRIVICLRQIAFVPNAGQAMLVPTAENDRFRFFRRGSVVDPCGRVDTRPYAWLAVVRRARGYAPLQGASAAWGQAALRLRCFVRCRDEHCSSAFAKQTIARRAIKQRVDWDLPPANCIRSECRTSNACPYGRE